MVRFIIRIKKSILSKSKLIYIPIWLDLLLKFYFIKKEDLKNLHSNMVRFIMQSLAAISYEINRFTFQYG